MGCFSILNLPYFCFHFTWSAQRVQQPAIATPTAVSSALFVFSFTLIPRSGWNGVSFLCTRVWVWLEDMTEARRATQRKLRE